MLEIHCYCKQPGRAGGGGEPELRQGRTPIEAHSARENDQNDRAAQASIWGNRHLLQHKNLFPSTFIKLNWSSQINGQIALKPNQRGIPYL